MFSQIKTISLYRLTRPIDLVSEGAASQFLVKEFFPRQPSNYSSMGWAPVLANLTDRYFGERLLVRKAAETDPVYAATLPQPLMVYQCEGHVMLRLVGDRAQIPPMQLKQLLDSRIEDIERQQGRALKKKEKEAFKDDILATLLPQAYTKRTCTYVWYEQSSGLMAVFAKGKAADDALGMLRNTIGSLPVLPIAVKKPPEVTMTTWLQEATVPAGFLLEDQAELRNVMEHSGIVRFKQHDLSAAEVKNHLAKNKKLVTKLALNWGDTVSFTLSDDLSITGVKWSDELREKNDDINNEDPLARMDADIALLAGEMSNFVPALLDALGGEESAPM